MGVYSIALPDGRTLDIEAGDEATAISGAKQWHASNPKPSSPLDDEAAGNLAAMGGNTRPTVASDEVFRGFVLPFRETADGKQEMALPRLLNDPIEAAKRLVAGNPNGAPGIVPLHAQPPEQARAYLDDVGAAGSFAAPGTMFKPKPIPLAPDLGGTPIQELAAAAERLGMTVPRAAATDNLLQTQLAGGLSVIPGVGGPLVRASRGALDDLSAAQSRLVDDLGGASKSGAGASIRDDVVNWTKVGSQDEAARIYEPFDVFRDKQTTTPLSNLQRTLGEISTEAQGMRLEPPAIVNKLMDAATDPKGLDYKSLQGLRTNIGDQISGAIVPEAGMSKKALKRVYTALSDDLDTMAEELGRATAREQLGTTGGRRAVREAVGASRITPRIEAATIDGAADLAKTAWDDANARFASEIAAKRDELAKLVGITGDVAQEEIVRRVQSYANTKGGANIGRLQSVMSVLGDESKNSVRATIISEMGIAKDGFSPARFRTELAKMSPVGRQTLFSPELNQALTDIGIISQRFEQLQKFGNPSGTARVGTMMAGLGGLYADPLKTISTAVTGYALARALASPIKAKAIANYSKAYLEAASNRNRNTMARLEAEARRLSVLMSDDADETDIRPPVGAAR